jgi:hypothetical protein
MADLKVFSTYLLCLGRASNLDEAAESHVFCISPGTEVSRDDVDYELSSCSGGLASPVPAWMLEVVRKEGRITQSNVLEVLKSIACRLPECHVYEFGVARVDGAWAADPFLARASFKEVHVPGSRPEGPVAAADVGL